MPQKSQANGAASHAPSSYPYHARVPFLFSSVCGKGWKQAEADLVVGGEGDGDAFPAEDGTGIATVGDNNLVRSDDGDDGGGADGVALWSLELAAAFGGSDTTAKLLDFPVHPCETPFHSLFPLNLLLRRLFDLLIHDLVHPVLASHGHLRETNTKLKLALNCISNS